MAGTTFDVRQLYRYLCASLRHGARACDLLFNVPDIIELLYPAADFPDLTDYDRALRVEADIRTVVDKDIGGAAGDAIAAVLALQPGTLGRTLGARRRIAADHLDIDAETFRKPRHEKFLLFHTSFELYRLRLQQEHPT